MIIAILLIAFGVLLAKYYSAQSRAAAERTKRIEAEEKLELVKRSLHKIQKYEDELLLMEIEENQSNNN